MDSNLHYLTTVYFQSLTDHKVVSVTWRRETSDAFCAEISAAVDDLVNSLVDSRMILGFGWSNMFFRMISSFLRNTSREVDSLIGIQSNLECSFRAHEHIDQYIEKQFAVMLKVAWYKQGHKPADGAATSLQKESNRKWKKWMAEQQRILFK